MVDQRPLLGQLSRQVVRLHVDRGFEGLGQRVLDGRVQLLPPLQKALDVWPLHQRGAGGQDPVESVHVFLQLTHVVHQDGHLAALCVAQALGYAALLLLDVPLDEPSDPLNLLDASVNQLHGFDELLPFEQQAVVDDAADPRGPHPLGLVTRHDALQRTDVRLSGQLLQRVVLEQVHVFAVEQVVVHVSLDARRPVSVPLVIAFVMHLVLSRTWRMRQFRFAF